MQPASATALTRRTIILWFRLDLRLQDNPALHEAAAQGADVLPVFIWAPGEDGDWSPGAASKWWLHHSLCILAGELEKLGNRLIIRQGDSLSELCALVRKSDAQAVYWNRRYEPGAIRRDHQVEKALLAQGVKVRTFNSALLYEPWSVKNKSGKPFQVFTPYWRTCLSMPEPEEPLPAPQRLMNPAAEIRGCHPEELDLLPTVDWTAGIRDSWTPGAKGAHHELSRFLEQSIDSYDSGRNRPDLIGTSRLSPHLHFGEISPKQVWAALTRRGRSSARSWKQQQFVTELGWREFAHHLLYHFPHTPTRPLRQEYERMPWRKDTVLFKRWADGRTGYPLVDAGMRQLWVTGWMHNRVRMVVASFLVKNLMMPWQEGARWFWNTLVDADLANNTLGWQWCAGSGADAAPFFRVFNPTTQAGKFDPEGHYIRKWVPELARLSNRWIHRPFQAPHEVLDAAGIYLGRTYPEPVVSLFASRQAALDAYARLKGARTEPPR